jgi:hypothetical protein
MNLTIRFLGLDLLSVDLTTDAPEEEEFGDCLTTPLGFTASPGDQRWELGRDL